MIATLIVIATIGQGQDQQFEVIDFFQVPTCLEKDLEQ